MARGKEIDIKLPTLIALVSMILLITRYADDMLIIGGLLGLSGSLGVLIPAYIISAALFRLFLNEWGVADLVALLVIGASMIIVTNNGDITPFVSQAGGALVTFAIIGLVSVLFVGNIGGGRNG